jgi:hypothetical protein
MNSRILLPVKEWVQERNICSADSNTGTGKSINREKVFRALLVSRLIGVNFALSK